ncbi:MAG: hypothetical protein WBA07_26945 [Rivularia sp. (in: cyanobacteria)]
MLNSYEAIIENGQVKWLTDAPKVSKARVIITILSDPEPQVLRRRIPPASIAGKGNLGDLVSSVVEEQDWECLK